MPLVIFSELVLQVCYLVNQLRVVSSLAAGRRVVKLSRVHTGLPRLWLTGGSCLLSRLERNVFVLGVNAIDFLLECRDVN